MNYPELLKSIMDNGEILLTRGQEVKEIMHAELTIEPYCNIYAWPEIRPIEKILEYSMAELAWYLSCDRDATFIVDKAKLWDKIKTPFNTLNSNYGYLVFQQHANNPDGYSTMPGFQWALHSLIRDKNSRQAVIVYNNGGYNYAGHSDFICSQGQAFYIRNNILHCYIALRSADVIWGTPYNSIWWSFVHQQLWRRLLPYYPDLRPGAITVTIYSAHIYKKHYELVSRMIARLPDKHLFKCEGLIQAGHDIKFYLDNLKNITSVNKQETAK